MTLHKPVITLPLRVVRRATKRQEKIRMRELEESGTQYPSGDRSKPPVISCRRSELNLYPGQRQNPFKKMTLATEHWASRKTIGDFITFTGHRPKPSTHWFDSVISEKTMERFGGRRPTFPDFRGLDERWKTALDRMGFTHPTNVQSAALPTLLDGQSAIVAAETGNGKTLAFLLPLLQRTWHLKEAAQAAQRAAPEDARLLHLNRPLAVVVAPGRELGYQIFEVARDLCAAGKDENEDGSGLHVHLCMGGKTEEKMGQRKRSVDVLIGTAGALHKMFAANFFYSGSVQTLVFDEADTLLDDTFADRTKQLLVRLSRFRSDGPAAFGSSQVVFVGATFPRQIYDVIGDLMDVDQLPLLRTGQLHRVPLHICQKFIRSPKMGRTDYLMDAIQTDAAKKRPVLVFSNKTSTSNFLGHFLKSQGVDCDVFNSSRHWRTRYRSLENFKAGKLNVLSCTDLASRGIDLTNLHHVINYDFPSNLSDYLHRVGRIGRAGSKVTSKVTNLVCGQDSIRVVQQMETAVRLGRELDNVDNNIIRIINDKHNNLADQLD